MERRTIQGKVELATRSHDGKQTRTIEGYGAVYYNSADPGTQFELWQNTFERIMPGAFDNAIKQDDVRSLFNHDSNIVLGRNTSGTLSLSLDGKGLRYQVTPPDTQLIRDQVLTPIERGDVSGSSFMFVPTRVAWVEEKRTDGAMIEIRQIEEVKLWEVGPVTFPAYESATSQARNANELERLKAERDQMKAEKRAKTQGNAASADDDVTAEIEIESRYRALQNAAH